MLLSGLAAATLTANAWRPFDRRTQASVPLFALGVLTSELPWHTLALEAAWVAAWRRRASPAGLALHLASAAGLLAIARRNRGAEAVLEAALDEAFPGTRADVDAEDAPAARAAGVVRAFRARRRYVHEAPSSYGPAGRRNELDVWRRPDAGPGAPMLLQVHGGAWILGSKEEQALPLMAHLAEHGWICAATNYRLSPRSPWPAQVQDVKRAVAWLKEHAAELGGDPDRIVLTGGSAGGHLTALTALTPGDPALQPDFEEADCSVAAAVPFYGAYDWVDEERIGHHGMASLLADKVVGQPVAEAREVYAAASPVTRVGPDAPPFFVLHGTADGLIPVEQARVFVQRLRAVSANPVAYAELPGAQHAFDAFGSVRAAAAAAAVERFTQLALPRA